MPHILLLSIVKSFSLWHGGDHHVQWLCIGAIWHPQQGKTGMHFGPHIIQHLFIIRSSMPLDQPQKASTFSLDLMGTSSSSLDSEQWPKCKQSVTGSFCLQTMWLSLPTQRKTISSTEPLCRCFPYGLAISLKKMQVIGQDVEHPPSISIADYELEAVR